MPAPTTNLVPNPSNLFGTFAPKSAPVTTPNISPLKPQISPYIAPKTGLINPKQLAPTSSTIPTSSANTYGQTITDTSGNKGIAKFNSSTGQPLAQVAGTTSSSAPATTIPPVTNQPAAQVNTPGNAYNTATTGLVNYGQGGNNNSTVNSATSGLINYGQGNNSAQVNQAIQNLQNLQDSQAKATAGIESTTEPIEQMQGQEGVQQRLYSGLLSNAQGALTNALSEQGQQIGALGTAGGLGQGQQAQNIGALSSAGSLSSPQSQFGVLTNPENGQAISSDGGLNAAVQGGAIQGAQSAAAGNSAKYQQGLAQLRSADNIQNNIVSTLQANPTLNSTPLSAITNLNQLLSGQISSGPQQILSQQINQYLQALGLDPSTVTNLASQQTGTLATLLDSLRSNFVAQNEGNNTPGTSTGNSSDPAGLGI